MIEHEDLLLSLLLLLDVLNLSFEFFDFLLGVLVLGLQCFC